MAAWRRDEEGSRGGVQKTLLPWWPVQERRRHARMEGREALQASDKRTSDEDGESDGGYERENGGGSLQWIGLKGENGYAEQEMSVAGITWPCMIMQLILQFPNNIASRDIA